MISEDFAILMIRTIKNQNWALQTFPEYNDECTELDFIGSLTLLIKHCKSMINEQNTLNHLEKIMSRLDNDKTRTIYLNHHDDILNSTEMNAALLCTLVLVMAGKAGSTACFKQGYTQAFKHTEARYLTQWEAPTAALLNVFRPITAHKPPRS